MICAVIPVYTSKSSFFKANGRCACERLLIVRKTKPCRDKMCCAQLIFRQLKGVSNLLAGLFQNRHDFMRYFK
jgi:hypothetical protein